MRAAQLQNNIVVNFVEVPDLATLPGTVPAIDINGKSASIGDSWNGSAFITPAATIAQQNAAIQYQITMLEAGQSLRAVREHILGVDTTRLPAIQAQIVALRAQLK